MDQFLLELAEQDRLPRQPEHTCSYFEERRAITQGVLVEEIHPATYQQLMDLGFRRSGQVVYRPRCLGCADCVPIRVPVDGFQPSRSQRRAARRNRDVRLTVGRPDLTAEKLELYQKYLRVQHPGSLQGESLESLRSFLYTTCVETLEAAYTLADGRLVAISILDASHQSLSSVYHFFDPDEGRRSLGVYSVVAEIELCRSWGLPYYYLGYWVRGSPTMDYKARYRPHELLLDGQWVRRE